jgi:hypothetical protein
MWSQRAPYRDSTFGAQTTYNPGSYSTGKVVMETVISDQRPEPMTILVPKTIMETKEEVYQVPRTVMEPAKRVVTVPRTVIEKKTRVVQQPVTVFEDVEEEYTVRIILYPRVYLCTVDRLFPFDVILAFEYFTLLRCPKQSCRRRRK